MSVPYDSLGRAIKSASQFAPVGRIMTHRMQDGSSESNGSQDDCSGLQLSGHSSSHVTAAVAAAAVKWLQDCRTQPVWRMWPYFCCSAPIPTAAAAISHRD